MKLKAQVWAEGLANNVQKHQPNPKEGLPTDALSEILTKFYELLLNMHKSGWYGATMIGSTIPNSLGMFRVQ